MRTTPNTASTRMESKLTPIPTRTHSTTNCATCTNQAANRLAVSKLPTAGTTRRKGSTSQSVRAKMNRDSGLPERTDIGMRRICMYRRSKQAPATNPAETSSSKEKIW